MKYAGKILIIVENLPVPLDTRVWQEANTLVEAGYKVTIISPASKNYNKKYEVINNISIYRHPLPLEGNGPIGYLIEYSTALFWEFLLTLKILLKEGFDVIHACNPPDLLFLIGGFYKFFGKKFVFDHHDINPELYIAKFGKKDFFYKLMLFFEKITYKLADIALVTNESFKEIAVKRDKMPEDKVFIVRNGPSLDRLKIQPAKNELKKDKKYMIGYLGVIGIQDGLDYLLDAALYIRNTIGRDDIYYAILGGGSRLDHIKAKCKEYKLDDIFEFTGMVKEDTIIDFINTADICVSPDEYNEMNDKSTMNKILEYMALGKPVVQFDLKEGRYSAQESSLYAKNNDIVDFAEKICLLLENEDMRIRMGQYGRKRIEEELCWDKCKIKLIEAYNSLLSSGI